MNKTGGAAFDPDNPYCYFIAANIARLKHGKGCHDHLLVAVNEINTEGDLNIVRGWIAEGKSVFIDSGVYNLAMEHATRHNVSHDVALAMAPDDIDGFGQLFDKYIDVIRSIGAGSWGYIEIDQGGRENKLRTRAKLESMGLAPVPVYHPFSDGWDYLDYLGQNYDRICFGNVVRADRATRVRMFATAWQRKQQYPNLWIHLLGMTPNEWLYAYPINSGDSSSWLSAVKWSGYKERSSGRSVGGLNKDFQYALGSEPTSSVGSRKASQMSAYGSYMTQVNWKNHVKQLEKVCRE